LDRLKYTIHVLSVVYFNPKKIPIAIFSSDTPFNGMASSFSFHLEQSMPEKMIATVSRGFFVSRNLTDNSYLRLKS